MKADIARTVIIIAVIFCFSYTLQGLICSLVRRLTSGGLNKSVIILNTQGDCKELEGSLFSALSAEPMLIVILAYDLTENGKRLCLAAQSYGGVVLCESAAEAAKYIEEQFEKGM